MIPAQTTATKPAHAKPGTALTLADKHEFSQQRTKEADERAEVLAEVVGRPWDRPTRYRELLATHYPAALKRLRRILGPNLIMSGTAQPRIREAIVELDLLGDELLQRLVHAGTRFFLEWKKVPDINRLKRLREDRPRGWAVATWDAAAGVYDIHENIVVAGKGEHGSSSLVLHEAGHALHLTIFNNPQVDSDLCAHHRRLYRHLPAYFTQDGPGGFAGCQELLAESIAQVQLGLDETTTFKQGSLSAVLRQHPEYVRWVKGILS